MTEDFNMYGGGIRNEAGTESIRRLLYAALVLQVSYLVLCALANLLQGPLALFLYRFDSQAGLIVNWPVLTGAALSTGLFFLLCGALRRKLNAEAEPGNYGVILGAYFIFVLHAVPLTANILHSRYLSMALNHKQIETAAYIGSVTVANVMGYLRVLSTAAFVLLCCAYAMYWFKIRHGAGTQL